MRGSRASSVDRLLASGADATLLVDKVTGTTIRRWYDPERSRLDLPDEAADRVIDWIHPDDLADVLETLARTAHEGVTRSTVARVQIGDDGVERSLLISVHDVHEEVDDGLLLQVWLVDIGHDRQADRDSGAVMSSLAAAAPVGLQVRSGNATVSFENERFTRLAAPLRDQIDAHIEAALLQDVETVHDIDGGDQALRLRIVPTVDDAGRLMLAVAALEDVTSLRAAEADRDASRELFRAVFEGSPVATAIVALDGSFLQVNESFTVICGYERDELIGRNFAEITHRDDLAIDQALLGEVLDGVRRGYSMEKRYIHSAGHEVWVELTVAPVRAADGEISHLVAHVEDITTRKAVLGMHDSSDDIAHWVTHDHLTGLPNRRFLDRYLATTLRPGRRADDHLAILFVDLDDFKPVNDEYGHQVGDEVLQTVARRLRSACRADELVARFGGDEFVVVTRRACTATEASFLADRISSAIRSPITGLADDVIRVGASVGVGIARKGDEPGEVLQRADAESYRAKAARKERTLAGHVGQ